MFPLDRIRIAVVLIQHTRHVNRVGGAVVVATLLGVVALMGPLGLGFRSGVPVYAALRVAAVLMGVIGSSVMIYAMRR